MRRAFGFTLLEVLVAVSVLAITMTALFTVSINVVNNHQQLVKKTLAIWVADNHLQQWRVKTFVNEDIRKTAGKTTMGHNDYQWSLQANKDKNTTVRTISVYEQAVELYSMQGVTLDD